MPSMDSVRQTPDAAECEGASCPNAGDASKSLCLSCGSNYCDHCWDLQGPHRPGKVGVDGLPHEKTDANVYERLKEILEPPDDVYELSRLHQKDENTTWFSIEKGELGLPLFQDSGRYSSLMADTKQPSSRVRYPQLVSFVGQTGAGKSTLIKMLVSLKEQRFSFRAGSPFESPVIGSTKHDKSPTSGDVHLYADPETAYTRIPMLYADCEGLEGGETPPAANKLRQMKRNKEQGQLRPRVTFKSQPREVTVAITNSEARNREWAVRKVYPRLLYTFSDVVVFVLRNPKTFESSALKLLLEWASTSLESSINQPTLPYAVIVLNTTDPSVDEQEWDVKTATENLMYHVAHAVYDNPIYTAYAQHWRKKGRYINSMLDLIQCYYASISVVRIPVKGRYMLANAQINKLHYEIVRHCDASFSAKDDAHMLSDVEELNSYLQAAFDHFTTKENQPFNFVEVAFKNNPIPRDFGDHMLGLAAKARSVTNVRDGRELFGKLGYIVASSIFTDCIRQSRPGRAIDLFDKFYAGSCTAALEHFCDKYWPCDFVSKKGKACVNVKSTHHSKGHQSGTGKIISSGSYYTSFSSFQFADDWNDLIKEQLQFLEGEFQMKRNATLAMRDNPLTAQDTELAYELHGQHLKNFYKSFERFRAIDFISLTTCYSCLMEVPEHPLQCGHVLCTSCVRMYGHPNDRHSVIMSTCPLHPREKYSKPWIIHFKPEFAGTRILSLDGGGMRGIIELEVLRAVEQALGGKIAIQAFFDLILGTSTGGIIALGLGVKQWSVNQCVTEFVRLCDQAFTPRVFHNISGLEAATMVVRGSKYRTGPFRDALQNVFGEEQLYGGPRKANCIYNTQVAVTATSSTGEEGLILANYSRPEENEPSYKFEFPHRLKVWEAASATSAAPSFFKPFNTGIPGRRRPNLDKTYLDGAIYYNNPARVANHESKFLWPDVAENAPDILLSIGTGKNGQFVNDALREGVDASSAIRQTELRSNTGKWNFGRSKNVVRKQDKPGRLVSKYFSVLVNRIDDILSSEREWRRFCKDISDGKQGRDDLSRYIRFNLDLGKEPPQMDEKARLPELQSLCTTLLKTDEYRSLVETIAHKLVASTFYFSKERVTQNDDSGIWTCNGTILCRFEGKSAEYRSNMRELGDFLRYQQVAGYQPYFSVKSEAQNPDIYSIPITESTIEHMVKRAEFLLHETIEIQIPSQLDSTMIFLCMRGLHNDQPEFYPISGFPRCLINEDTLNATRLDKRAELIKERRYGGLIVANDPKIVFSSKETANRLAAKNDRKPSEETITSLEKTETSKTADSRESDKNSTRSSKPHSSFSSDEAAKQKISINELRAQVEKEMKLTTGSKVEDGEEIIDRAKSASVAVHDLPDFGSDESDGPPSEADDR